MKMFKRFLRFFFLAGGLSLSLLLFFVATETGLHALVALANSLAAGTLSIGSSSGTLLGSLQLGQIRYADASSIVSVDQLHFSWQPGRLIDGRISVQSITSSHVRIKLNDNPTTPEDSGPLVLAPLTLPLQLHLENLQINDIALASGGEELQRFERIALIRLTYQGDMLEFAQCTLTANGYSIQAKGEVQTSASYKIRGTVNAQLTLEDYAPMEIATSMAGPLDNLKITADLLQPTTMHLAGELKDILGTASWSATLQSRDIDLQAFNPQWPQQSFRRVSLEGEGSLETYQLTLDAETGVPGLPAAGVLSATVRGNASGLELSRIDFVEEKKGKLAVQGRLQWSPVLSWQADVFGSQIDPSLLFPQWPGNLSGKLTTKGTLDPSLDAQCQLVELKGTLRGYPLNGQGRVEMQGTDLKVPQFSLQSGSSRLEIKGTSSQKLHFDLSVQSKNLAEVYPKASGRIDAKAKLQGTLQQPEIDLNLEGTALGFDHDKIDQLKAAAKGRIANNGLFKATLQIKKAMVSGTPITKAALALEGSLDKHTLTFSAKNSDMEAGLSLQGAYNQGQWLGTLRQSHLAAYGWGNWQQQKASALRLAPTQITLAKTCLRPSAESSVCVDGSWSGSDQLWKMQSIITTLPVKPLAQALNAPWPVLGSLNTNILVQGKAQRVRTLHILSDTLGLQLTTPPIDGQQQNLSWLANTLRIGYENNQLRLRLISRINEHNSISADIRQSTPDPFAELLKKPIQGELLLDLQDLNILSILSNQAVIPSGSLQGKWKLNGPPLSPRLAGEISLSEGKAEIPALGITLSPLHLSMKGDAEKLDLDIKAKSGSGELSATSTLNLAQTERPSARIHLVGENFHAAKLPGMDLTLSPDLILGVNDKEIRVQGLVKIPQAQITSINFDQATAPSDDVIIIDDTSEDKASSQPLYLNLDIVTGKEVKIDAYGLRGTILGNLRIDGQPGRPLIGTGTLSVNDSTFSLYGKRLKINVGRVLYSGGPLTNPGLELRSERKTDKATTGVIIGGFLQHPEISFYSTPTMEQSAIIQNLLEDTAIGGETREDIGVVGTAAEKIGLGSLVPFLQSLKKLSMIDEIKLEGGNGEEDRSLVFGSWLTPDLYVSYGKDLAKESGTFNTTFNLGHGFSLLTETGASVSGGDIKYEFEH